MSDIARKAAEKFWGNHPGMSGWTKEGFIGKLTPHVQAAIEEATRELSRKCFDLTEEIAELRSQESPDTKRLAEFVTRCGDHMISGSNIADTPLPTEQEWREILSIAAAMNLQDVKEDK